MNPGTMNPLTPFLTPTEAELQKAYQQGREDYLAHKPSRPPRGHVQLGLSYMRGALEAFQEKGKS
jgi:hypothetical protein